MNETLHNYITRQLGRGASQEAIRAELERAGWPMDQVSQAFASVSAPAAVASESSDQPTITEEQKFSSPPKGGLVRKILFSVLIAVVVIGLGVGGVFAYQYFFPAPEQVMKKMGQELIKVKSFSYKADAEILVSSQAAADALNKIGQSINPSAQETEKKEQKVTIQLSGVTDARFENDIKSEAEVTIAAEPTTGFVLPQIAVKTINQISYFKLAGLPLISFLDLSVVDDKWIKIDAEEIFEELGLVQLKQQMEDKRKELGIQEIDQGKAQKIKEAAQGFRLFEITGALPAEEIDGAPTRHYQFNLNKGEWVKMIFAVREILEGKPLSEEVKKQAEENIGKIDFPTGEIWIGKKDFLPHKLIFAGTVVNENNASEKLSYNVTLLLKHFNENVLVETPESFMTIKEVLEKIFSLATTATTDADADGLTDEQEATYGTDPLKADTDNDGYKDGDEVKNGYNPRGSGKLELTPPTS